MNFLGFDSSISRNGYAIPKDQFKPNELEKLKKELTATPLQQGNFAQQNASFPIYLESPKKIYMPRYYRASLC
jgi:hypothetical protein